MTVRQTIGGTDIVTPALGLGTNKVGKVNGSKSDDENGASIVTTALDHDVKMLDTAFVYGLGRSEEIIGQVIKNFDRHQIIVADKAAQDPKNDLKPTNDPDFLKRSVDQALQRLGTDYIDIFYIHFPDTQTPKYEAVGALQELKQAGKIRAIGVSNFSLAQLQEANQDGYVDVVEDNYSLVHRDLEQNVFAYLKASRISFVPYFPLASGLLTGKYQADQTFPTDVRRYQNPNFKGTRYQSIIEKMAQIKKIAAQHQATPSQVILAWYIANPAIATVIPGASVADQVLQNVGALNVKLSAREFETIDHLFTNLPE